MTDVVRSAARVLDLVAYFHGQQEKVSLATVSKRFSIPKSSAFILLKTLCSRGYLVKDEQGRYQLNEYFREHGFGWGSGELARVKAVVDPVMKSLSRELCETITLGSLKPDGVLRIDLQALSPQAIRYETSIGAPFPLYCTAMGRILLSGMPRAARDRLLGSGPFPANTPLTVTDRERVHALMDHAGEQGYCIVANENELGGTGVAMVLHEQPGEFKAALNVACISARFPAESQTVIDVLAREVTKLRKILTS